MQFFIERGRLLSMEHLLEIIPAYQLLIFAFFFGASWGSFANVVIVRWPKGLSVVRPASHCPSCEHPIAFYDNIPVLSYFLLRGKCRHCRANFSPRYAVVELCMGLLAVAVLNLTLLNNPPSILYGLTEFFVWFAFVWALVTAGMIDLETFLLPDAITLPGVAIGILVNAFVLKTGWIDFVVGAFGGYAVLALLFVHGYKLLTGYSGMGEGDPKLVAMIGAFLGIKGAVFAVFVAAIQGLVIGSILLVVRKRSGKGPRPVLHEHEMDENGKDILDGAGFHKARVPFGPFLALGAIEYLFLGDLLLGYYTTLLHSLYGLF